MPHPKPISDFSENGLYVAHDQVYSFVDGRGESDASKKEIED
jgi:hypothetical protein